MTQLRVMSLNGEDMIDLIDKDGAPEPAGSAGDARATLVGQLIERVDPDILGLVEAPPSVERTRAFVQTYVHDRYEVYQGEARGTLGLALLVRRGRSIQVQVRDKTTSLADFSLREFDADGDGIKELYSWANRVPFEAVLSGADLAGPATFIVIHSKSKGAFIPGDLFAYERLSRANRMKLRAQADAVRTRLDKLVDDTGHGRVVVMGDMNDAPDFDVFAAMIGGAFLEHVVGSVWDPIRIFHDPHHDMDPEMRWTIDFQDRVVNPMGASKYGTPTDLRSWIDHILVSPELKAAVVLGSAQILHHKPVNVDGVGFMKPTDHHPPFVTLEL